MVGSVTKNIQIPEATLILLKLTKLNFTFTV